MIGRKRFVRIAIAAAILSVPGFAAAAEIAPLPHRALEQVETNEPVPPPAAEGTGQPEVPQPPGDGGNAAGTGTVAPPPVPPAVPPPAPPAPARGGVPGVPPAAPGVPPGAPAGAVPGVSAPVVPPPPVPGAAARPAPSFGGGGGFFVKFNNADIYEVIHTLARTAGINYLIDPRVKGVVNVHTQGVLRKDSALDLLYAILKINGATAIREGDTYHIVPMAEAKSEPLMPLLESGKPGREPSNQVVMRAYPLQYIGVSEMSKVIKPFLSPGGDAIEVSRANILLVVDTAGNQEKTARLVELFDSEVFRAAGMKLFRLQVLDPEEMAKNLENIFGALDFSAHGGKPAGINFVPIPRLNALLVVSASPKTMEDVEKWIGELDRPGSLASRTIHRYRVRYGKVKDVAAVLEKLYPGRTSSVVGEKTTEFRPSVGLPGQASFAPRGSSAGTAPSGPGSSPGGGAASASASVGAAGGASGGPGARTAREARGEAEASVQPFDIIPDESTNSLIIRASLSEYAEVLEILKTVDVYPQQVLLEVLVGEVTLSDDLKLGIDWKWQGTTGGYNQTATLLPGFATSNFNYVLEKTNRLTAVFKSLAENGRASVLSSPSIMATNGKKSKINVADQIPIETSVLNTATNPPVTTTTVEYRDVGVILSFTPYINDSGLVTLEIEQEVSEVNTVASGTNPTFFKRSLSTNLVASQDQSIVLGGLVKERKSLDRSGLPWIYKIPVIGWLFGSREDSISRTELLIFITPRVIRSVEEGVRFSRDFEERVAQLKNRIREVQGIRLRTEPVLPVPNPLDNPQGIGPPAQ